MIELVALTKKYRSRTAVDAVTCTIPPGAVTGFLGPNGAGKSTTMRMIVGLSQPTAGRALVGGRPYRSLTFPAHEVGALLEGTGADPARRCIDHLRWLAAAGRIPARRAEQVLDEVGLTTVAGRRAGRLSLGMRARLGIAAALLGDPAVLLLDEPMNGLDPEGIAWIRGLLTDLAGQGRTVLVSSHLVAEMALCAERVVVIGRGRLLAEGPLADVIASAGIAVREFTPVQPSLEQAYLALTREHTEHSAAAPLAATRIEDTL